MPCAPPVLNLPAEEVRAQVGEGGKGEPGGTRGGSSISNSSSNLSSSRSNNSNLGSSLSMR